MLESLEFIKPTEAYFDEYLAACQESIDNNVVEWMPVEPERLGNWKESAKQIFEMLETGEGLPEGYPRTITWWCVEGERFVGEVQIRPNLSEEEEKSYGHIGYAVRYSLWNRGFGTRLLTFAVEKLRESCVSPIYITCHTDNRGSNRVSQKVGFEFLRTREDTKENLYILR